MSILAYVSLGTWVRALQEDIPRKGIVKTQLSQQLPNCPPKWLGNYRAMCSESKFLPKLILKKLKIF